MAGGARIPSPPLAAGPARIAAALGFAVLAFTLACAVGAWVPAPVWRSLKGLFWLAMMAGALSATLRTRRPKRAPPRLRLT